MKNVSIFYNFYIMLMGSYDENIILGIRKLRKIFERDKWEKHCEKNT